MNVAVELPESDYERLQKAAAAEGITPAEWIAARLPAHVAVQTCSNGKPGKMLAERFVGRVGVVASGGKERLSERHSEVFAEMLEEQRKAGRL